MYPEGSAYPLRNLWDAAVRGYAIRLTCRRCRHVRTFHAVALWWLFERKGWANSFNEVRRRTICAACRDTRRQTIRHPKFELVHEEIDGDPLPLPSQQDWKRALARHR